MIMTNQNDTATAANRPALDLDASRPELEALARATVDKTLQQARETSTDPVLGSSSALATFYMMMPRNDGRALEEVLDIVARHVEGLTFIRNGLKFGIDPNHLGLVRSNPSAVLAQLQSDHDPDPRGPTYRADGLVINHGTGKACLLEFKRQASTIETTRLNQIADNLTIARAQVSDLLYRKHKRMRIEPDAISWAIIDCSDQQLQPRFRDAGVFGLDSLDAICGIQNVAKTYRLARELMAEAFRLGEAELMRESRNFIPLQTAEAMVEAAVTRERLMSTERMAQDPIPVTRVPGLALNRVAVSNLLEVPDDPEPMRDQLGINPLYADHSGAMTVPFPADRRTVRRRYGLFGS
ncbi:hypothetical protein [Hoeflea sp.]|uniref:hypothetical protein n=1 Tax=Hoeflea sp. TaxID=1940281 RepID=UPI003A8D9411